MGQCASVTTDKIEGDKISNVVEITTKEKFVAVQWYHSNRVTFFETENIFSKFCCLVIQQLENQGVFL